MLMSIHPRHVAAILAGTKEVELRRVLPKGEVSHVVMYATAPAKKIVGWFEVAQVEVDQPKNLWPRVRKVAGVSSTEYSGYFRDAAQAVAFHVRKVMTLSRPANIDVLSPIESPPQSFQYVSHDQFHRLTRRALSRRGSRSSIKDDRRRRRVA